MYEYSFETLPNGLRLVAVPLPHVHSVAIQAVVHGGSAYEQPSQYGISHLLEHLHMGPTRTHPTRHAVLEAIDAIPGEANAHTGESEISFEIATSPEALVPASDLLSEILEVRAFSEEIVDSEKRLLETELTQSHEPGKSSLELLFPDHSFGASQSGTARTIARLDQKEIAAVDRQMFAPDRIAVAVAGPIRGDGLDRTRAAFARLESGATERLVPPPPPRLRLPQCRRWPRSGRYRWVSMGFVLPPPLSPLQRVALNVLNMGLMRVSSPLFERLRYGAAMYEFNTSLSDMAGYRVFWVYGTAPARDVYDFIREALRALTSIGRRGEESPRWFAASHRDYLHWMRRGLDLPENVAHRVLLEAFPPDGETPISVREEFEIVRHMTAAAFEPIVRDLFRRDRFFLHYHGRRLLSGRSYVKALVDSFF